MDSVRERITNVLNSRKPDPKEVLHLLLAVVESGFGDFEPFNKLVRSLFSGESAGDLAPSASAVGKARQRGNGCSSIVV